MKNVLALFSIALIAGISASYGQKVSINSSVEKDTLISFEMSSISPGIEGSNKVNSQGTKYAMSATNNSEKGTEFDNQLNDSAKSEERISIKIIDSTDLKLAPFRKEN